ncbi:telomere length regulation elg1 [Fusarium longipes]|uniref:Telomere length regulation elg1 n=1 Tax=Fusarium longipes TaxID=694270 RepID=A0A395T402_9HYPO|nr:telomere length regulation elg1 [Fusarium longipes]
MGSVLVERMAQEGIREPEVKKVHPFFTKGPASELVVPLNQSAKNASDDTQSTTEVQSGKKRRKTETVLPQDAAGPKKQRRTARQTEGLATLSNTTIEQSLGIKPVRIVSIDNPTNPTNDALPTTTEDDSSSVIPNSSSAPSTDTKATTAKMLKLNLRTVCMKYGHDDASRKELGDKISKIMDGKIIIPPTPPKKRGRKLKETSATQKALSAKATHPLFTGKAKQALKVEESALDKPSPSSSSRHTVFMSTPMSPKKARNPFVINRQAPRFGVRTGVAKVPGAMQPLWPAKGMAHVRGFDIQLEPTIFLPGESMNKKFKGSAVTIRPEESVLEQFCATMDFAGIQGSLPRNDDCFEAAPEELRKPSQHFESGRKLQKRIRSELRTLRTGACQDDDQPVDSITVQSRITHPSINRLYQSLETNLSAYDRSTCESLVWTHKYAPATASEILQSGKEALLLKDWLQALTVESVISTGQDNPTSKKKTKTKAAPKKKRKKDELDDFIVSSEEEANEMEEVSENEDDWAPAGSGLLKKTVVRNGDVSKGTKDQERLTNAVVISGPHGSGKTATVYAIAKELGYEIFEIHPGSRRSGKDIIEKVGDMTRNHLVQQHRAHNGSGATEEDEVARDLKAGKQGTMTSFFQKKAVPQVSTKKFIEEKPTETTKASSTKSQKQSLILLEEVDILYEEDKQFWATLTGMIAQSKRPFVMTCNDEKMVPLQTLNLHGIFRFSPPPIDLAVDLCLLTAANEGHILRRTAVEALYKSRKNDLRAALTELNYWCQIGVGDRKGGSDWFYLRWPKGSDLDENGDVVRVLSEETYCKGLGWVGRDLIATCPDPIKSEEEALKQSWDSWTVDMGDWDSTLDIQSWADGMSHNACEESQRLEVLEVMDRFYTSMGDADLLSSGTLGIDLQEIIDPELPEMPVKMRDDFILGRRLLEADPKILHSSPSVDLSFTLKSLARQTLLNTSLKIDIAVTPLLEPLTEKRVIERLNHSFEPQAPSLNRMDLAYAFDPIAINEKAVYASHLDPSVFDRTTNLIVLDVAPWVRGIVEFDNTLMQERLKLGNLLSEGGTRKRMRTTRSAYSAMEGSERRTTRRERYFADTLNTVFVRRTAGEGWKEAIESVAPEEIVGDSPTDPSSPVANEI